ncbi:MAG TPA: zinc ribbon domain-containing protein [Nitrospinota bacterium]|nr:zinc ribbon domain-containing protein [Nitrospinota bacterium]
MPIYEYECQKCGTHSEVIQKISEPPLKKCESNGCNGKLRRLMSNSSFVLKGSGWYVTDYPSEARKKGMESEKKSTVSKTDNGKKASGDKTSGNGKKASTSKPAKNKKISTN